MENDMDANYENSTGLYRLRISKTCQFEPKLYSSVEVHMLIHFSIQRYLPIADAVLMQYDMTHKIKYFRQSGMESMLKEIL